jgi:putative flippase GtrA
LELSLPNASEIHPEVDVGPRVDELRPPKARAWTSSPWHFARFGLVGVLNTLIDVLTLNVLLWRFPTHSANLLLLYNTAAYGLGALNSLCLNKYWTFKQRRALSTGEIARFAVVSLAGILCSDSVIWLAARTLHPVIVNSLLWANLSKGIAIAGTMVVSYVGMRLWVFARRK